MRNTLLAFCLLVSCAAQAQRTNASNGQVVGNGTNFSNVVVAGGGGGCTPSYANPGGSGNRDAILLCASGGSVNMGGSGVSAQKMVTNSVDATGVFFISAAPLDGVTTYFIFTAQSGTPYHFTEDQFLQENSTSQGTWKWQGSQNTNGWVEGVNDASIWTDVGGTFSLATAATTTHSTTSGNSTDYKYWRALGVSGNSSSNPWVFEWLFKICGL